MGVWHLLFGNEVNKIMELEKQFNSDNSDNTDNTGHGGARKGAGRPKGSTHKITAKDILATAQQIVGKPLVVSIMEGYRDTIIEGDRKGRQIYEKMLLDKSAATMLDVEVEDVGDLVSAKALAFSEAIKQLSQINPQDTPKE